MHSTTSFSRRRRDDVAKTSSFSRIVHHFSTLRRSEPYSGGIGLKKIHCQTFSSSWVERNPDFPVSVTGLFKLFAVANLRFLLN